MKENGGGEGGGGVENGAAVVGDYLTWKKCRAQGGWGGVTGAGGGKLPG